MNGEDSPLQKSHGLTEEVKEDWEFSDGYAADIERILYTLAHELVSFRWATSREDLKEATDFVVEIESKATVAGRVRKLSSTGRYRDLSLRHSRDGRMPKGWPSGEDIPPPQRGVEEYKIRNGYGRWYLYIWAADELPSSPIAEWVFVDLDMLREQWDALVPKSKGHLNRDKRTAARYIAVRFLEDAGAIVRHEVNNVERAA